MKIPGGIVENLKRAGIRARKQRGKSIPVIVRERWEELIREALNEIEADHRASATLTRLIFELKAELDSNATGDDQTVHER